MKLIKLFFVSTFILFASIAYAGPREDRQAVAEPREDRQIVAGPRADWQAVADAVALTGHEAAAADIEAALSAMTDKELESGYAQMDLVGLAEAFLDVAETFEAFQVMNSAARDAAEAKSSFDAVEVMDSGKQVPLSVGFPDATGYPSAPVPCPFSPDRSDADALLIAVDAIAVGNVALEIAQGIWSVADRGCGTVVVVAGFGGNPQNALCIITDTALFVANAVVTTAEAVVEHIAFCDGAVDSAEIEGAYDRTGHIHTDLSNHDANIDGDLVAHDANIDGDLVAHDANIDGDLAAHDANIDGDLAAHDANIDADLITHDGDIKALLANLQGAVDENQRLIKITMSRQQEIMRLLITPSGRRLINMDVLTCTGDDCPVFPALQLCPNGSLSWNCED